MIELSLIWNKGQILALQIEKCPVPESALLQATRICFIS